MQGLCRGHAAFSVFKIILLTESLACYYSFYAHQANETQLLYAQQHLKMGKFQLLLLKSIETIE